MLFPSEVIDTYFAFSMEIRAVAVALFEACIVALCKFINILSLKIKGDVPTLTVPLSVIRINAVGFEALKLLMSF